MQQEEEVATTDPETRRKHFYQIEKSLVVSRLASGSHSVQGPVTQKFRNLKGLFRVPQFPPYFRNAEVLSHSNFPILLVFLTLKTC